MGRARRAVVDAHLHVWDLERSEYSWLTPELGPLYATYTPEQVRENARRSEVEIPEALWDELGGR